MIHYLHVNMNIVKKYPFSSEKEKVCAGPPIKLVEGSLRTRSRGLTSGVDLPPYGIVVKIHFFYFSIMASRTAITRVTLRSLDQEVLVAVEQSPTNISK